MARIQHISFATNDPPATAEFYKRTFGLTELRRKPKDSGVEAVFLTDGYFYITIEKFRPEDEVLGGQHITPGIGHIGFGVDDLDVAVKTMVANDGRKVPGVGNPMNPQYLGPDGVMIDMRLGGWDGHIRSKTQLYKLVPDSTQVFNRESKQVGMRAWLCVVCGFVYDEAVGMPEHDIQAGTCWEDVPADWFCPDCGASKSDFEMVQI